MRLTVFALCISPVFCSGQDSLKQTHHLLFVELGVQQFVNHDLILSPMTYKGASVPVLLSYENSNGRRTHVIDFYFAGFKPEPNSNDRVNNVTESVHVIDLAYQYDFILRPAAGGNFSGGLRWGATVIPKNQTFKQTNTPQLVTDGFSDLSISMKYCKFITEKNTLALHVKYAMVSYVLGTQHSANQPPADLLGTDFSFDDIVASGHIYSLADFTDFQTELTYVRSISARVHWTTSCGLRFISYSKAGPNEILLWGVTTGLTFDL